MKKTIYVIIFLLVVGGIIWLIRTPGNSGAPGKLDSFAQCINDSGAKFYGAFWCPHCQNQKDEFGKSAKLLPYVECSTPDGRSQLPICDEAGIKGYPTWRFSDGTELTGEISLEKLSEVTSCPLPESTQ
jgi:hypothetical protein